MADFSIGAGAPGGAVVLPMDAPPAQGFSIGGGAPGGAVALPDGPSLGAAAMAPQAPPPRPPSGISLGAGLGSVAMGMAPAGAAPLSETSPRGIGAAAMGSVGQAVRREPRTALGSALDERDDRLSSIYDVLAQPKSKVTKDNWKYPIVQEQKRNFYGGGQLEVAPFEYQPGPGIPRNEGETDEDYAARSAEFEKADMQGQMESYQRNVAEQKEAAMQLGDTRDIGAPGHLGMAEAKRQAAEGVGDVDVQQAERAAAVQAQVADMSKQATQAAMEADRERRAFAMEQRNAMAKVQKAQQDAHAKLGSMSEMDAGSAFRSQTGGQKFLAILGALAGGSIGSHAVPQRLNKIASDNLAMQKAITNDADAAVGEQVNIYRDLLGAAGDEATADAMFLQAQLEDGARMLEAQLAETTVPAIKARIQESLVGLRQQINDHKTQIDSAVATTPRTITRTIDPLGAGVRKKLEGEAKRLEGERTDFQKLAVGGEEKALERDSRIEEKRMEGQSKVEAQVRGEQVKADMDIKKASDEWGAVETLVGDFLKANPDDIAGVGAPLTGNQNDRIRTRQFKRALELLATSGFTGATATERQAEQIKSMVEGDMWEMTDDAFRTRMGEIMNIASARRRYYQGQLGSPDARIGDPAKGLSTFKAD